MALNYKLFFKYILFHNSQIFIKYLHRNDKNLVVFIPSNNFYYLALHLKLSSLFYSTQLVDIFAYEVPTNINFKQTADKISFTADSIIFYNFHSILFQQRFFIISTGHFINNKNKRATLRSYIGSVAEIFPNANWLEREAAELHGIFFSGKKDIRNLMLTYGDTNAPLRKSFPSIGIKEIYYDSVTDTLVQSPVSIQF